MSDGGGEIALDSSAHASISISLVNFARNLMEKLLCDALKQ